jgi:predicted  nucleic acid-binding Zn-ribbon protein
VSTLKTEVSELKTDMQSVQTKLGSLETDMTCVKLTLENEIRVNIQTVAEGHLDLARNLKEATKPNEEFEWLSIRLRALETEVRNLKAMIT